MVVLERSDVRDLWSSEVQERLESWRIVRKSIWQEARGRMRFYWRARAAGRKNCRWLWWARQGPKGKGWEESDGRQGNCEIMFLNIDGMRHNVVMMDYANVDDDLVVRTISLP